MTINKHILLFCLFLLCLAAPVLAQTETDATSLKIPRYDIGVTLEYRSQNKGILSERMIQTQLNGDIWRVNWLSVGKTQDMQSSTPYPTYQVKTTKGILEGPMVGSKTRYFHPMQWPEGYAIVADAYPLWIDPIYLDLKRGVGEFFSIGFLKVEESAFQGLGEAQASEMQKFRDVYNDLLDSARADDKSALKTFEKHFFELRWLANTKFSLKINGSTRQLPAKVLGNRYFEMTILDQYDNPLVLALRFFPDRVPSVFGRSFTFFKKNFEFQVTQVQF